MIHFQGVVTQDHSSSASDASGRSQTKAEELQSSGSSDVSMSGAGIKEEDSESHEVQWSVVHELANECVSRKAMH